MEATLHHQWKGAFEQGKLSYVPTTLMMSGNLEGTIWKMILLRSRHVSCVKLTFTFMMWTRTPIVGIHINNVMSFYQIGC